MLEGYAIISEFEGLRPDGLLIVIKSGHGVLAGMIRKPERAGNGFYYRYHLEGKMVRRSAKAMLVQNFGVGEHKQLDEYWFKQACNMADKHNTAVRLMHHVEKHALKPIREIINTISRTWMDDEYIAPEPDFYSGF